MAELSAILAGFAEVAAECEEIRKQGDLDADRIQKEGRERSLALVAQARRDAAADREAVIAEARRDADASAEEARRAAEEQAEEIRSRAAAGHDDDLAHVVSVVRERLRALTEEARST